MDKEKVRRLVEEYAKLVECKDIIKETEELVKWIKKKLED